MNYLVYTDLDGTLLDHTTYQYSEALGDIHRLQKANIPIIPVTSKTKAELSELRSNIGLDGPFVVENGAAVYIPLSKAYGLDISECEVDGDYAIKAFSENTVFWSSVIESLTVELPDAFRAFSQMDIDEIVALTGLSKKEAALAANRQFSDPIHWFGSEKELSELESYCERLSISVVKGGRFVHLIKGANKGLAVRWLTENFRQQFADAKTIALGDGENDLSMLAEVDYPVQIKSDTHDFPVFAASRLIRTTLTGPAGWAEAIQTIIQ